MATLLSEAAPAGSSADIGSVDGNGDDAKVGGNSGDEGLGGFDERGQTQGIKSDQAIAEVTPQLDDASSKQMERFKRQAEMLVESHVVMANELQTDEYIVSMLQSSPVGQIRGDPKLKTHVLVYYDPQESGETMNQPHLRSPPLRAKGCHMRRFIRLVMARAGGTAGEDILESDVHVINDTGNHGNKPSS